MDEVIERVCPCADWARPKGQNVKAVSDFIEGATVFTISRMWSDVITSMVLRLHEIPYCGDFMATACVAEAPARSQFMFANIMALVAGTCKYLSDGSGLSARAGMWGDIPMILYYIVGWAFGNAMVKQLVELTSAHPSVCHSQTDCTVFNIFFSTVVTACAAFIMTLIEPYTSKVECGDGVVIDTIELVLQDVWKSEGFRRVEPTHLPLAAPIPPSPLLCPPVVNL